MSSLPYGSLFAVAETDTFTNLTSQQISLKSIINIMIFKPTHDKPASKNQPTASVQLEQLFLVVISMAALILLLALRRLPSTPTQVSSVIFTTCSVEWPLPPLSALKSCFYIVQSPLAISAAVFIFAKPLVFCSSQHL